MQFAGSDSWSLSVDGGSGSLDATLYIRDIYELPVPSDVLVPPPLASAPVALPWPGTDEARVLAGRQWLDWWHDLVGTGSPAGELGPFGASGLDAFVGRPELRRVATAVWETANRSTQPPIEEMRTREEFPYPLVKQVVEDVAFDRGVATGRLYGRISVVAVAGPWWVLVHPGRALAAVAVHTDLHATQALLRSVFESSLH